MQLEMIGAAIGVDDEVGDEIGARRLHQDVDALGRAGTALRVADDPAYGVAGGDGAGTDKLFARLERDVGDFARRGIDLIERAIGERVDLDGVEIARPGRLNAGRAIRLIDARVRIGCFGRCGPSAWKRLELARQRQRLRQLDDLHGLGRIGLKHRLLRRVVVADLRRLPGGGACAERDGRKQQGCKRGDAHQPSSFDQLRAWT